MSRVKVRIPSMLRISTNGQAILELEASNVRELIEAIRSSWPGLHEEICDPGGEFKKHINVYVNSDDIRFCGLERDLREDDVVSIVAAVAGG